MSRKPLPRPKEREGIPVWCHKHFDPVLASKKTDDPINGTAATEFLLRRFAKEIRQSQTYKNDIENGMSPELALNKALANLAPICCLYEDDISSLLSTCRIARLAITHPHFNDVDEEKPRPLYIN